jgi:hypothetical protein
VTCGGRPQDLNEAAGDEEHSARHHSSGVLAAHIKLINAAGGLISNPVDMDVGREGGGEWVGQARTWDAGGVGHGTSWYVVHGAWCGR